MKKYLLMLCLGLWQFTLFAAPVPKHIHPPSDDVANILQSIPSPLEVCFLIKEINKDYNRGYLNNSDFVKNYTMSHKQALNLGIYSTDLGYTNLYEQTQDVLNYIDAVQGLAKSLNISQYFDYDKIKKLAQSKNNLDELLQLTQSNFEQINEHLRKRDQTNLSALILTGGWIEGLYISTMVYEKTQNPKLKEKIGEQQIALEQIRKVLTMYKDRPHFAPIIQDLDQLHYVYSKVKIVTTAGKPILKEEKGELVYNQEAVSRVEISNTDIVTITSLVKAIRDKMVK